MLSMSETNHNIKKSQSSQVFITIVVVVVVTLAVALYKINRTQERIENKNINAAQNVEQKREKLIDKYMDDYAEGAAWAMKNKIADPQDCEEAGVSSLNNLGCMTIANEYKEQVEMDAYRAAVRDSMDQGLGAEELAPEDQFLNDAYLEPEIN